MSKSDPKFPNGRRLQNFKSETQFVEIVDLAFWVFTSNTKQMGYDIIWQIYNASSMVILWNILLKITKSGGENHKYVSEQEIDKNQQV